MFASWLGLCMVPAFQTCSNHDRHILHYYSIEIGFGVGLSDSIHFGIACDHIQHFRLSAFCISTCKVFMISRS